MPMIRPRAFDRLLSRTLVLALLTCATAVIAADQGPGSLPGPWPQWGGPDRNFITSATGLAGAWPEGGPPLLWSRPLGLASSARPRGQHRR